MNIRTLTGAAAAAVEEEAESTAGGKQRGGCRGPRRAATRRWWRRRRRGTRYHFIQYCLFWGGCEPGSCLASRRWTIARVTPREGGGPVVFLSCAELCKILTEPQAGLRCPENALACARIARSRLNTGCKPMVVHGDPSTRGHTRCPREIRYGRCHLRAPTQRAAKGTTSQP